MKLACMLGEKAGMIALLTLLTQKDVEVDFVISYSHEVTELANMLKLTVFDARNTKGRLMHDLKIYERLKSCDWLLCVHGRDKVRKLWLDTLPCVNIHPGNDGSDPLWPLIRDVRLRDTGGMLSMEIKAHIMTEEIDKGDIIILKRMAVWGDTIWKVYNELYEYYARIVLELCMKYRGEMVSSHVWKNAEQVQG